MIEIRNVSKTYKNGVEALRNISLTIADGEFCFIVGRSGSGKSTLVRLLTKELEPTEGEITVNELALQRMKRRHVPKYRRRLGVVFQDFRLLEDRTVYENVGFAELIAGKANAEIRNDVAEMLERVGLSDKRDAYPRELSGGEQQRTAIARALINQPEILIADEPTGNLDHENALSIMKLLESIHAQGTTVIVITHDLELVRTMQKRTVHMAEGQILSDTVEELSMPSSNAVESADRDVRFTVSSVLPPTTPSDRTCTAEDTQKGTEEVPAVVKAATASLSQDSQQRTEPPVPRRGRSRRKPETSEDTERRSRPHHFSRKKGGMTS